MLDDEHWRCVTVPAHQKLDVYHLALDIAAGSARLALKIPEPWGDLRDQLRRAATSIALNIAEGAAEMKRPEKARFYRIARRSAAETMAVLDVLDRVLPVPPPAGSLKRDLDRSMAMLTRLAQVQTADPASASPSASASDL